MNQRNTCYNRLHRQEKKTIQERDKYAQDTKKVEDKEEKIRRELRTNCKTWIFVLPSKALSLGTPTQQTLEDDLPQAPAAGKTPTPKAVQELKPKQLLTQNMPRPTKLGKIHAFIFQSLQL